MVKEWSRRCLWCYFLFKKPCDDSGAPLPAFCLLCSYSCSLIDNNNHDSSWKCKHLRYRVLTTNKHTRSLQVILIHILRSLSASLIQPAISFPTSDNLIKDLIGRILHTPLIWNSCLLFSSHRRIFDRYNVYRLPLEYSRHGLNEIAQSLAAINTLLETSPTWTVITGI